MTDFKDVSRASNIVQRMSILLKELDTIATDNPLMGEYISSIISAVNTSVTVLNERLDKTIVTALMDNINKRVKPLFDFDIDVINKQITLRSNPKVCKTGGLTVLEVNIVLDSYNVAVSNGLMLILAGLTQDTDMIGQLDRLIQLWYPEPSADRDYSNTWTSGDVIEPEPVEKLEEVESTEHTTSAPEPTVIDVSTEDSIDVGTLANMNYKDSILPEVEIKDHEHEKNETPENVQTENTKETPPTTLDDGSQDPKFREFVTIYLNDHNSLREFSTLKGMVEQELNKGSNPRSVVIKNILDAAESAGMNKEDYTSNLLLELAAEVVARNAALSGKPGFAPEQDNEEHKPTPAAISATVQPLLAYLVLRHDILSNKLLGDRNCLEVIYHMFEFDKYKNIISSQSNVSGFYGAVRSVVSIFSRHNWKLNFHQNTIEIQNPLLPMDTWTKEIKDIGLCIDRIVDGVKLETDFSKMVKLRDIEHDYSPMKPLADLSLNGSSDFIEKLKEHVSTLLANDVSIAVTTAKLGDLSDKESVIMINRNKTRALLVLPNNIYAMNILNNKVTAVSTIGQYDLTNMFEWLTYFELNYGG